MKTGPKPRNTTCHPERRHYCRGLCKACYSKFWRSKLPKRESRKRIRQISICHPDKKHLAKGLCKTCYARQLHWSHLNFTINDYNKLYKLQKGLCAICGMNKKLMLDHNHNTNVVRGLLCHYCNTMLVTERNTEELLRKAADYTMNDGVAKKLLGEKECTSVTNVDRLHQKGKRKSRLWQRRDKKSIHPIKNLNIPFQP